MKPLFVFMLCLALGHNSFAFPSQAVFILGGKLGSSRSQFEKELDLAKSTLEENGVNVLTFYSCSDTWPEIASAANEADILVYSGHGVSFAGNYGGFLLANGQIINSTQIQRDLHFKKNVLVYFLHTCGSAGSSASDLSAISEMTAQNRVINYAAPFIKSGAIGVLASNWNDQLVNFIYDMYSTQKTDTFYDEANGDTIYMRYNSSLGEAYTRACNGLNQAIVVSLPLPQNEDMYVYLSHNDPSVERITVMALSESGEMQEYYMDKPTGKKGKISYELAFVGNPSYRW